MYIKVISPYLKFGDAETWHKRWVSILHCAEASLFSLKLLKLFSHQHYRYTNSRLKTSFAGINLDNPLMVGAGWDKAGVAVKGLYTLGFAGVEVGSVALEPQIGNPLPRYFNLGKGVVLNRFGFNTPGADAVAKNLEKYKHSGIPIGISIGINKYTTPTDAPLVHTHLIKKLHQYATYFAINVSSPNTPGLRNLQQHSHLTRIVKAVNQEMKELGIHKPVFVKIAPDLSFKQVDEIIAVVTKYKLAGIIAANTTNNPEIKRKYGQKWAHEAGGLSGNDSDFRNMSTILIRYIYRKTAGETTIIGSGGIRDTHTALQKITAGATALQIVTAISEKGPSLAGQINKGLIEYMDKKGIRNISELRGLGAIVSDPDRYKVDHYLTLK